MLDEEAELAERMTPFKMGWRQSQFSIIYTRSGQGVNGKFLMRVKGDLVQFQALWQERNGAASGVG